MLQYILLTKFIVHWLLLVWAYLPKSVNIEPPKSGPLRSAHLSPARPIEFEAWLL